MPTMLRTSKKARKIALNILGAPENQEKKKNIKKEKELNLQLLKYDERMAR